MPTLACPYCQYQNDVHASVCDKCHQLLSFTEPEIGLNKLKVELNSLKILMKLQYEDLNKKLGEAERKLDFLRQKNAFETIITTTPEEIVEKEEEITIINEQPLIQEIEEETIIVNDLPLIQEVEQNVFIEEEQPIEEIQSPALEKEEKSYTLQELFVDQWIKQEVPHEKPKEQPKRKVIYNEEHSYSNTEEDLVWQEVGEFFTKTLMLGVFFAPFAPFFSYFADLYNYYKRKDRLPVFFTTIGGIIALLFGFGYLMQFVSDFTFELIKISGTFSFNTLLIFLGIYFHKKEHKYHNFGSSLMGLSISLNLLLIYFLSYSQFFTIFATSPLLILILILLNSVLAFYLALRYDTRIVLIISLFGGAFAPFYLGTNIISGYYFVYLWLLSAITVLIALKINWQKAGTVAFTVCTVIFGIIIFKRIYFENIPRINLTIALMAFAYLFYFFTLYKQKLEALGFQFSIKQKLEASDIFTLVSNTVFLIINLFYAYQDQKATLGYIYLFNALIFVVSYVILFKNLNEKFKVLWFTLIGIFVALSIPLLLNSNLTGIFWSLEGLALVFCGFMFRLGDVRKEGYLILGLGFIKMLIFVPDIVDQWQFTFWTNGYRHLLGLGIILITSKILIDRFMSISSDYEKFLSYIIMEILTIWALLTIWIPLHFYLPVLSYNLMILFVYGCLVWAYKYRLPVSEAIAFLCLIFLAYGYFLSTSQTNTFLFPFQTTLAKIAIVELFLSLWFFQFMYEKVLPKIQRVKPYTFLENTEEQQTLQSLPLQTSRLFREIFFLSLPTLLLPTVLRLYPEYTLAALSVSVLIAFVVTEITKKIAVKIELHILVLITTITFISYQTPLLALSIGLNLLILGAILVYSKGLYSFKTDKNDTIKLFSEYRYLHAYTIYHFALLLSLGTVYILHFSELMGFFVFTIFLSILVLFKEKIAPIQLTYKLAHRLVTIIGLGITMFVYTYTNVQFKYHVTLTEIIALVFLVALFYGITYTKRYPMQKEDIVWDFDLLLVHVITLGLYSSLIKIFSNNVHSVWTTILITVHACILLFHSTSKVYQFSLKISIALFVLALGKLYFVDMQNASLQQKIITFMVIGVVMLIFPYLFMKYKEKSQKE